MLKTTIKNQDLRASYTRVLKVTTPFMTGEDVRAVQNRLNQLGFNVGTADGVYGNNTAAKVKSYQSSKGLVADGMVGPSTWGALFDNSGNASFTRNLKYTSPMMQGNDVQWVQKRINAHGYSTIDTDGIFGQGTHNAVVKFQNAKSLSADGIVGRATWDKLAGTPSSNGGGTSDYHRVLRVTSPLMFGDDIKKAQKKLIQLRYNVLNADGYYGNFTCEAVKKFQSKNKLSADGEVGPSTWNKLFSSSAVANSLQSGEVSYMYVLMNKPGARKQYNILRDRLNNGDLKYDDTFMTLLGVCTTIIGAFASYGSVTALSFMATGAPLFINAERATSIYLKELFANVVLANTSQDYSVLRVPMVYNIYGSGKGRWDLSYPNIKQVYTTNSLGQARSYVSERGGKIYENTPSS